MCGRTPPGCTYRLASLGRPQESGCNRLPRTWPKELCLDSLCPAAVGAVECDGRWWGPQAGLTGLWQAEPTWRDRVCDHGSPSSLRTARPVGWPEEGHCLARRPWSQGPALPAEGEDGARRERAGPAWEAERQPTNLATGPPGAGCASLFLLSPRPKSLKPPACEHWVGRTWPPSLFQRHSCPGREGLQQGSGPWRALRAQASASSRSGGKALAAPRPQAPSPLQRLRSPQEEGRQFGREGSREDVLRKETRGSACGSWFQVSS